MTTKNKQLSRLYGEFIINFEFICSSIRFSIFTLLYPASSTYFDSAKRNICEIMTEGLTADSLQKKLYALIVEKFGQNSDLAISSKLTCNKFRDFIELRNSFAHGTTFIGTFDFIPETKKDRLTLRHPKIKTNGLDLNFKSFDSNEIATLNKGLLNLKIAFGNISILIRHSEKKASFKQKFHSEIKKAIKNISQK